jgi:small GTP-binding protein
MSAVAVQEVPGTVLALYRGIFTFWKTRVDFREPDGLRALLDKAHPDELSDLAERLDVDLTELGHAAASERVDWALRELGGLPLRSWRSLLAREAKERGLGQRGSLPELELRVLANALESLPSELRDQARSVVDEKLGVAPLVPARRMGFLARLLQLTPAGWILSRLFGRLPTQRSGFLAGLAHVVLLRAKVQRRVTVGVVGSPSAGKDAAIKTLFGLDSGNIHPIAGSTTEVSLHQLGEDLFLVNTPGLGDVMDEVTERTRQILRHIDVYVYVLNVEGGVQAREQSDHAACVASGKPVLVCVNKVDVLREGQLEPMLEHVRAALGTDAVLPCAFDPLPVLADEPLGVDESLAWLQARLAGSGKQLPERAAAMAS